MTEELLTPTERKRMALHKAICEDIIATRAANPLASDTRIFQAVAQKNEVSMQHVRHIAICNNLYTPKTKNNETENNNMA